MKKFAFPILALVLGLATTAFTVKPQKANPLDPQYHWFASNDHTIYLGFRSAAIQEIDCPGSGNLCADAFTDVSEDELPAGSYMLTVQKQ